MLVDALVCCLLLVDCRCKLVLLSVLLHADGSLFGVVVMCYSVF